MTSKALRHKTYGISLPPDLRQRAEARAAALGLSFSRYTSLCLEAELKGQAQLLTEDAFDLERALSRARDHLDRKTHAIDFQLDIAEALQRQGLTVERYARMERFRADFTVVQAVDVRQRPLRIALECRYHVRQEYAIALGQALLLRAQDEVDAVLLVVPYLEGFDAGVLEQFREHSIRLTTPDRLFDCLRGLVRQLSEV